MQVGNCCWYFSAVTVWMWREYFKLLSSLFCLLCLWSVSVVNSAFCRATFVISFKISSRSVFYTWSLLMEKGSQEAKCSSKAGSLPALQAEPGHSLLLCASSQTCPDCTGFVISPVPECIIWVLNYPEILHRNSWASSGKPAVNQAGVLPGQASLPLS